MMQVMPMPCCGAEPPLPTYENEVRGSSEQGSAEAFVVETTDYSKFGWDPETNLCRACGENGSVFQCASPSCRASIEREPRFCEGCQGAFKMGRDELAAELRVKANEIAKSFHDLIEKRSKELGG